MEYVVPGLLVVALIEALVAADWWPPYLTRGLVLYRASAYSLQPVDSIHLGELTSRFKGGVGPSLVFHELDAGVVAFREALFELRLLGYTPVMHGVMRLQPEHQRLELEARANWFPFVFSIVAGCFVWSSPEAWPVLGVLGAILVGIGVVQARLYRRVVAFIVEGTTGPERSSHTRLSKHFIAVLTAGTLIAMAAWWYAN